MRPRSPCAVAHRLHRPAAQRNGVNSGLQDPSKEETSGRKRRGLPRLGWIWWSPGGRGWWAQRMSRGTPPPSGGRGPCPSPSPVDRCSGIDDLILRRLPAAVLAVGAGAGRLGSSTKVIFWIGAYHGHVFTYYSFTAWFSRNLCFKAPRLRLKKVGISAALKKQ
jgi:hypothetical protein